MRSLAALAATGGAIGCGSDALPMAPPDVIADPDQLVERRRRRHTPINLGLRDFANARGLVLGTGVDSRTLRDNDLLAAHAAESGMVVPLAEGQWEDTHPAIDTWDFRTMDRVWRFAQTVNLPMRGTHLIHHASLPPWFYTDVTPANAAQVMEQHIVAFLGHFQGLFHSWNVVNEAVFPVDGRPDGLRNSPWMQLLGPQYIDMAFTFASQVDPTAVLTYNDFGCEADTSNADMRRAYVLQLLQNLVSAGVPVHALGLQAHLYANTPLSATKLTNFMNAVQNLGLGIFITELDVSDQSLPADHETRDAAVAAKYYEFLQIVLPHPAVSTVVIWGLSDRITWLSHHAPRKDGLPPRVLPLDADLQRKEAWLSIANALRGR
ncbi:MAG: Endo-1,4-beta-xylanase Z [Gemmatimonadaceae bacterium]|nr:Endo-1,4-beta-xylanase Z [Gemmatimonadaceae bacterium]